jgi:lysylphosphatidylglycerol synthetase-like protein (DUF2156 family)
MIIYYNLDTLEIVRGECDTMTPILPFNMTIEEKQAFYKSNNEGYVAYADEIGSKIFNYDLVFDENGDFIGLQHK